MRKTMVDYPKLYGEFILDYAFANDGLIPDVAVLSRDLSLGAAQAQMGLNWCVANGLLTLETKEGPEAH